MSSINSSLRFTNYIVENIEFNTNFNFTGKHKELDFDIDSQCDIEEDNFILHLGMIIFPNSEKNDYPFTMKIKIIGLFEIEKQENKKTKGDFIERNSIAILFPYLRALISVYSSNANIGTIILPPINVVKYLEGKKKLKERTDSNIS